LLVRSLFGGGLPSLIMFDLDGTLVDSVPDLASAVDKALLMAGLNLAGEEKVRAWVGNGVERLVERAVVDQKKRLKFDEVLESFQIIYSEAYSNHTYIYPGVISFLEKCRSKNIKLSVITNKPECFTLPLLKDLNIRHYFCNVLSGDSFYEKKPHPFPLRYQLNLSQVCSSQSLMIGDSISDLQAAKAAGVPFLGVSYGYNHGEPLGDFCSTVVDSFDEINF